MPEYPDINTADEVNVERVQRQIGSRDITFVVWEKVHGPVKGTFIRKTPPETAMAKYHDAVNETFRLVQLRTAGRVSEVH